MFGCRVSQGGSKTFVIKHRNRRITIGRFPTISLSEARTEAKRLLAEFTLGKVRPQTVTYKVAVHMFLEEKTKQRKGSTVDAYAGLLTRLNFQGQLTEVTVEEIRRKLSNRSNHNHYLVALKVFFNWCIKRRYVEHNPTISFSKHAIPTRARVLTDAELLLIWRACEQRGAASSLAERSHQLGDDALPSLPANFATIVKLLILTGMRRNECASLQTSWIKIDTSQKASSSSSFSASVSASSLVLGSSDLWTITLPSTVTKNGREHTFPITAISAALLEAAIPTSGTCTLLFPARGQTTNPFNGWSKSKSALDKLSGVTGWTLHDLRRTYATNLARLGTPIHVVEKLLNHASGSHGGIVGVYQRHQYWDEQVKAVEKYDDFISNLIR